MNKISETIVFFGSGPVAAQSLQLLSQDFKIEAVITKPRAAHHHGDVPVISLATRLGLPLAHASNRRELNTLFQTAAFTSRLAILIDFGIIISQQVIDYFPLGIINSHFSILPELRGADPITFAILSGQKQTGVSTMLLVEAMDEGPLLGYGEYNLAPDVTTPELTHDLINLSHALLLHDVPRYASGESKVVPQSITGRQASYSRKLSKQDGFMDCNKPASQIEREIRAFIDWPKSRLTYKDLEIILTKASVTAMSGPPGTFKIEDKKLYLYCKGDALQIERLKPAGKRDMSAQEFLAGYAHLL